LSQALLGARMQLLPHSRFTIMNLLQLARYHKLIGSAALVLTHLTMVAGLFLYFGHDANRSVVYSLCVPLAMLCLCVLTFRSERKVVVTAVAQLEDLTVGGGTGGSSSSTVSAGSSNNNNNNNNNGNNTTGLAVIGLPNSSGLLAGVSSSVPTLSSTSSFVPESRREAE